ncbi:MAG: NTP transferase domain-containing protein [Anaerolineales bacterium]|nr:NTP transferase domain-containing protein [Anaerolineales bacterium]
MPIVDALVVAGGVPAPNDPLYPLTRGRPKALLELAGQPMIRWVLDALAAAQTVRHVIVIGLNKSDLGTDRRGPLACLPAQGGIADNLIAGATHMRAFDPPPTHILAISSDIPLITAPTIDWVVRAALETGHDAYYTAVPAEVMERRFPDARRSYFRLKEGRFAGADLHVIGLPVFDGYNPRWRDILEARKSALRVAALVGFDAFVRLALGLASVPWAEQRVRERLGLNGRLLICPHAEAGMDVDKPEQYELVKRELEGRGGK